MTKVFKSWVGDLVILFFKVAKRHLVESNTIGGAEEISHVNDMQDI